MVKYLKQCIKCKKKFYSPIKTLGPGTKYACKVCVQKIIKGK